MTTLNPLPPVEEQPITSVAPALANEEDWFKPCALIPVYNHERSLPAVVAALRAADLPCVLVDTVPPLPRQRSSTDWRSKTASSCSAIRAIRARAVR